MHTCEDDNDEKVSRGSGLIVKDVLNSRINISKAKVRNQWLSNLNIVRSKSSSPEKSEKEAHKSENSNHVK